MSAEGDVVVEVAVQEVITEEIVVVESLTMEDALRQVLRNSLYHDGLSRGLREAVKALDQRAGKICILAESCEEKEYVRLIEALCAEHKVQLVKVADAKQLGEWVGLCKIDKNGDAQKVVACACAVVREYGVESTALEVLLQHVSNQ